MIAILQLLLTIAAAFGLWRFWRRLDGRGAASLVIAGGFLIRAFGGQLLFWISWLRIPVARSLQIGDGIWFFGLDGAGYLDSARRLLGQGVKAILLIDATYASHLYTQFFTLFAGAFGAVASTAILFNCAAYLATCALVLRIGRNATARARLFALAAISFGPATILWSLQPLKDTFFTLLMTAAIALFAEWQKRPSLLCAAAMCVAVYEIAGTRWYVGAILAGCSLVFLALVANLPRPRLAASAVAAVLFLMLGLAFLVGGADDVPRVLFRPKAEAATVKTYLAETRRGFETTPGATAIAPGTALQKAPPKPAETEVVSSLPTAPVPVSSADLAPAKPANVEPSPTVPATEPAPTPAPSAPIAAVPETEKIEPVPVASPPKKRVHVVTAPAPKPAVAHVAVPVQVPRPAPVTPPPPPPPPRLVTKLATGAAAMFVPRAIAQPFGLVRIGGGRGFWLFADADTLVFDFVILFAFAYCARSLIRRELRVTPLFILVVLVFAAIAGPMIYSVTNFGTMFRLRGMVFVLAALLPLTTRPSHPPSAPSPPCAGEKGAR